MSDLIDRNDEVSPQSQEVSKPLDLSELAGLSFGPAWSSTNKKAGSVRSDDKPRFFEENSRSAARPGFRPDRRQARFSGAERPRRDEPRNETSGYRSREPRYYGRDREYRGRPSLPVFDVQFYPEDAPFKKMIKAVRGSCRTFELFEIANLILAKPERFVVLVKPRVRHDNNTGLVPIFYCSQVDGLPFESESEAVDHAVKMAIDRDFTVEEIEVEAPKGTFTSVSRCGYTGELLGPSNYHRYQQLLQEHHALRLPKVPFDKFKAKIETLRDKESVDAWLEKMKKVRRYTPKAHKEGEPDSFETLEAVKSYLLRHKDSLIKIVPHIRLEGSRIAALPQGVLKSSIEETLAQQQKFPLVTANNLRGRLRRLRFNIYKKGGKGVSYLCAVRRKFRTLDSVFSPSIQALIDFIEKNPYVTAEKLPEVYLEIDSQVLLADEIISTPQLVVAQASVATEVVPAADASEQTQAPAETSEEAPSTPVAHEPSQRAKFKQLLLDLRWLVTEGYVTEYGDGRLYAPAPIQSHKDQVHPEADETETHLTEVLEEVASGEGMPESPSEEEHPEESAQ